MKRIALLAAALGAAAAFAHSLPSASYAAPVSPSAAPFHCQVPCGIYGDKLRIAMMMEDAATIEKGMNALTAMDQEESPSKNQLVRWVLNKDQHAQYIQDQVAAYWLAQRIKAPKDPNDADAREAYHRQLELMHGITVAAMKCKQTTDVAHVESLRTLALQFSETYFSAEDLEHIREHHEGEHGR